MIKKIIIFSIIYTFALPVFAQNEIAKILNMYDSKLSLLYYIEGNYTNSEYKEVIGFFDRSKKTKEEKYGYVFSAFCFQINEKENRIVNIFELDDFQSDIYNMNGRYRNINSMDFPLLGRKFNLGWVGDFNKNGIEEIYLFQLMSWGFYPVSYEFRNGVFQKIIDYENSYVEIIKTDQKNIEITLDNFEKDTKKRYIVFKWDDKLNKYIQKNKIEY